MKKLSKVLILASLFSGYGSHDMSSAQPHHVLPRVESARGAVLMMGDCQRIRYEQDTRRALGLNWNVWSQGPRNDLNMGQTISDFVGYSGGLDYPYDVVTMGAGIWDQSTLLGPPTPPAVYKSEVQEFIDDALSWNPATIVLLVEVTICDSSPYCQIDPATGIESSVEYNIALHELAAQNPAHVQIAPLAQWQIDYGLVQFDGMHFTQESYKIIGSLMAQAIREAAPQFDVPGSMMLAPGTDITLDAPAIIQYDPTKQSVIIGGM